MKYKIILFFSFLLLVSCDHSDNDSIQEYNIPQYAVINGDQTIVVNNTNDFNQLLGKNKDLENVDFSHYTLVITHGVSNAGILKIAPNIYQKDGNYYITVQIKNNYTTSVEKWNVAYLIPKVDKPTVKVSVSYSK